ncbi:MAG: GC-type dockerin domain-anchored protein [Planctomycetota bacterium]
MIRLTSVLACVVSVCGLGAIACAQPTDVRTRTVDDLGRPGRVARFVEISWTNAPDPGVQTELLLYPQDQTPADGLTPVATVDSADENYLWPVEDMPRERRSFWLVLRHVASDGARSALSETRPIWPIQPGGVELANVRPLFELARTQIVNFVGIGDSNTAENEGGTLLGFARRAGDAGLQAAGFGPFPAAGSHSTRRAVVAPGVTVLRSTPGGAPSIPMARKLSNDVQYIQENETVLGLTGPVSLLQLNGDFRFFGTPIITERQDMLMFNRDWSARLNAPEPRSSRTNGVVWGYFARGRNIGSSVAMELSLDDSPAAIGGGTAIWDGQTPLRLRALSSRPTTEQRDLFAFPRNRFGLEVRANLGATRISADKVEPGFITLSRFNPLGAVQTEFSDAEELDLHEFAAVSGSDFDGLDRSLPVLLNVVSEGLANLYWISAEFAGVERGFVYANISASGHGTGNTNEIFDADGSSKDEAIRAFIRIATEPARDAGQQPAMIVLIQHGINGTGSQTSSGISADIVTLISKWSEQWAAAGEDPDRIGFVFQTTHMVMGETFLSLNGVLDQPTESPRDAGIRRAVPEVVADASIDTVRVAGYRSSDAVNLTNGLQYADEPVTEGFTVNPSFATHLKPSGYDALAASLFDEVFGELPIADFDLSGVVNISDLFAYINAFTAPSPIERTDITEDGVINISDLFAFIEIFLGQP